MSRVESVLPSLTTMTSKSCVRRPATCTARMTRLAIVPPSLYAGKNMLSPVGRVGRGLTMDRLILGLFRACRETPRHDRGLGNHHPGQLRRAFAPLDERDWHLGAAQPRPRCLPRELDDERVPVGSNRGERQPFERFAPPAAESARAVANRQARDPADVVVGERAEHPPVLLPILETAAWLVPRSHDEIVGVR